MSAGQGKKHIAARLDSDAQSGLLAGAGPLILAQQQMLFAKAKSTSHQ